MQSTQARTCTIDGCTESWKARRMCSKHYQAWWEHGGKASTRSRIVSDGGCSVDSCNAPHEARGYCDMHYQRVRRGLDVRGRQCESCDRYLADVFGERYGKVRYCSDECKPRCAVEGCGDPVRKTGLCGGHYAQRFRGGEATPWQYRWNPPGGVCRVCGRPAGLELRSRIHCSAACQQQTARHGIRLRNRPCALCGDLIDLMARGKSGRIQDCRTRLCATCRRRKKFKTTVLVLAKRDGIECGICGEDVDLTLKRAESVFCASIDHIVPRAHGGTDDPTNLQLAHYWCNAVKSDRESFTI